MHWKFVLFCFLAVLQPTDVIDVGKNTYFRRKFLWPSNNYLLDLLYFSRGPEGNLRVSFETLACEYRYAGNSFLIFAVPQVVLRYYWRNVRRNERRGCLRQKTPNNIRAVVHVSLRIASQEISEETARDLGFLS